MIRKTVLAIAAVAAIGAATLAPTSASAHGGKRFFGHGHGHWKFAPIVVVNQDCGWKWFRKHGTWYKVWACYY